MAQDIQALFSRYEALVEAALAGDGDGEAITALYAPQFIGAAPAGVRTGRNDATFRDALRAGYDHYRAIGTKSMRIRALDVTPVDALHAIARVGWSASYAREGNDDVVIDFDVHYLVQEIEGALRIFGWISGDEDAELRRHGII